MDLRLITPPASLPVSLDEALAHLRVDHTDEDAKISALIQAATDHLDGWSGILGRALMTQTWELVLPGFPGAGIEIPLGPVQSVTSVTYVDPAGQAQVVSASDYYVSARSTGAVVAPLTPWPGALDRVDAVAVRFVAGFGNAASVPAPIKAAILLMVGDFYRNTEAQSDRPLAPNAAVQSLLSPYRMLLA
jgi:uncharacterized phiE125 gp8 family phage protein